MPKDRITDILSEYDNLQFLYEYGFAWKDKEIAKRIWNKSSQMAQRLNDEKTWEDVASVIYQEKGQRTNNTRKLVNKNHYRMQKNQWIPYVYGMYGMKCDKTGYEYEIEDSDFKIKKEPKEMLENLSDNVKNDWTQDKMIGHGKPFKNKEEYCTFVQMLSFFVEIAPLSTLGYNFLRRLDIAQHVLLKNQKIAPKDMVSVKLTNPYIIVRNPFVHDALEQESVFRCLYAIQKGYKVEIDGIKYIPEKVEYKGNGFEAEKVNLYLKVKKVNDDVKKIGKLIKIKVDFYYSPSTTAYLRDRRRNSIWNKEEYKKDIIKKDDVEFKSPYYEDTKWHTECVTYEIPIEEQKAFEMFICSFGDFANVCNKELIEKGEIKTEEHSIYLPLARGEYIKIVKKEERTTDKEYSLCNVYNSNGIFEEAKKQIEEYFFDKRNPLEIAYVRPTEEEIAWVRFVLQKYPNFVKMFLGNRSKEIVNAIVRKCTKVPDFFCEENYDFTARVVDMKDTDEDDIEMMYHKILKVIAKKEILQYQADKLDREVKVLPYALEYNIMQHIVERNSDPMLIMCYDLEQKRDVIVKMKDIPMNETYVGTDEPMIQYICSNRYSFSFLDKIYHILAYATRCAIESEKNKISVPYQDYVNKMFKNDERGNENYERCIKKYINKPIEDLEQAIERWQRNIAKKSKNCSLDLDNMIENVFAYYMKDSDKMSIASNEENYYLRLRYFFYKSLNDMLNEKVDEQDLQIADSDIWRLIVGDDIETIPNEIAYYDEALKCEKIAFQLKNEVEKSYEFKDAVNQIFEIFSDYVCRGMYDKETASCKFVISYERFNYRDIHMRIMALSDIIDFNSIEPPKELKLLKQRYDNYIQRKEKEN